MAGPERTETKGEDKKEDEEDRRLSETRLCVCTYVHIYIYTVVTRIFYKYGNI